MRGHEKATIDLMNKSSQLEARVTELLGVIDREVTQRRQYAELLETKNNQVEQLQDALSREWRRKKLLSSAVLSAARQFELYAEQHSAKGTAEGQEKAMTNRRMAAEMRSALNQ